MSARTDISVRLAAFSATLSDESINLLSMMNESPGALSTSEEMEAAVALKIVLVGFEQLKPLVDRLRHEYMNPQLPEDDNA